MFFRNIVTILLIATASAAAQGLFGICDFSKPASPDSWELNMYAGLGCNEGGIGFLAQNYWHGALKIEKKTSVVGPCHHLENGLELANSVRFTTRNNEPQTKFSLAFYSQESCKGPADRSIAEYWINPNMTGWYSKYYGGGTPTSFRVVKKKI
ncbi:hypothetical protein BJ138DRAFT_1124921 [Hygrophoropsis aurantiaca]|uniref:Uncharacterized protein n=1 Tax=Hygrophoropsis aurantiaca TaxID=72124 RepID=A0ACB8AIL3_9AGAM|nr:hypothetical protein BJ138DRAFT_1124921 [Hygrophoropsis aurantiaca]